MRLHEPLRDAPYWLRLRLMTRNVIVDNSSDDGAAGKIEAISARCELICARRSIPGIHSAVRT
jgi:hypothetical protein